MKDAAYLLKAIRVLKVLVVGDICLDKWCVYRPALTEPSRETGLPRTAVIGTQNSPGAGGTVCNNLRALGVQHVSALGVFGDDGHGKELLKEMTGRGIHVDLMQRCNLPTFTYTKLVNEDTGLEDLSRVDFVNTEELPASVDERLCELLRATESQHDLILVADQAEHPAGGVVTARMRGILSEIQRQRPERFIWVDSRLRPHEFRQIVLKPNRREADLACDRLVGRRDYQALRRALESPLLIVTLDKEGALIVDDRGERVCPTPVTAHPVDVTGAGDSFTAGAATALAVTRDAELAVQFGNLVASITIMKPGTATASPEEVLAQASAS